MNKLILTDCDGVLCNWEWAFKLWMQTHGWIEKPNSNKFYNLVDIYEGIDKDGAKKFTKLFNESAAIGFLPALRDSVYYVKRLHEEHGYKFRIITSLSTDPNAIKLRVMNLEKLFGNAIEDVISLETGADKDHALEPYRDSGLWWIEDKLENADVGHALGLKSILVEHGHNMHHQPPYPVVKNWKEIYDLITGEQ